MIRFNPKSTQNYFVALLRAWIIISLFPGSITLFAQTKHGDEFQSLSNDRERYRSTSSLDSLAAESRWIARLIEGLKKPESDHSEAPLSSIETYLEFEGLTIRSIHLTSLDVFGPSFQNLDGPPMTRLGHYANIVHIDTRERIIENYLLFKIGDKIDPYLIAETERLLRSQRQVEDARIYIFRQDVESENADILVVVKDLWSLSMEGKLKSTSKYYVQLNESNFLGQAQELKTRFTSDTDFESRYRFEGKYLIKNAFGSFSDLELKHTNGPEYRENSFQLERPLITASIRYTGGYHFRSEFAGSPADSSRYLFPFDESSNDLWLGRSWPLTGKRFRSPRKRTQIAVVSRYRKTVFRDRPSTSSDILRTFHNSEASFAELSLIRRYFHKTRHVFEMVKAEDIPSGFRIDLRGGYELGEYFNRSYSGVSFSASRFSMDHGYASIQVGADGFRNGDKWEQATLNWEQLLFTPLQQRGRYRTRQFLRIRTLFGLYRFEEEYLTLKRDGSVHGWSRELPRGEARMDIGLQNVLFTPWNYYEFHFQLFAFGDFSKIGNYDEILSRGSTYSAFGLGIKAKNERLIFPSIKLFLGYYPGPNPANRAYDIGFDSGFITELNDFSASLPGPQEFR